MDTFTLVKNIHKVVVLIFLLIYLVKTIMLLTNKSEGLKNFISKTKVLEMIVSFLFLATGVYLLTQKPELNTFMMIKLAAVLISIPLAVVGFKKSNKALATISLLLIITAYGMAEMAAKRATKKELSTELITDASNPDYNIAKHGEAVFKANCILCHGEDGTKSMAGATNLATSQIDEATASQVIAIGRNTMQAFNTVLSEQDIKAVSSYIQTLKKP